MFTPLLLPPFKQLKPSKINKFVLSLRKLENSVPFECLPDIIECIKRIHNYFQRSRSFQASTGKVNVLTIQIPGKVVIRRKTANSVARGELDVEKDIVPRSSHKAKN